MSGFVANAYVRVLHSFLQREGLDAAALGIALPETDDPLARIPVQTWGEWLTRVAQALNRPTVGLEIGQCVAPHHFGVLGYVTLHCATLGDALLRLQQYERLVYAVSPVQVSFERDAVVLRWGQEAGRPGALVDETALAALITYARNLTGTALNPLALDFVNPPPIDAAPYTAFFGCPVRFGQAHTLLRFATRQVALPLRQPDPHLRALLDDEAQRLLQQLPATSAIAHEVQTACARLLPDTVPSLQAVARALHRSPRTLQRQLQRDGLPFQAVIDDTRRQLANGYLQDPHLTLTDIAGLLGYAEQSAFTRAYRRWTGMPPNRARWLVDGR
jgi:AraC-like DNA-binding protein